MDQLSKIKHIENSILKAAKYSFPEKRRKQKNSPMQLKNLLKERKKLLKEVKSGNTQNAAELYKLNKIIKEEIRIYKKQHIKRVKLELATKDPTKEKFWNIYRQTKTTGRKIPALRDKDGKLQTDLEPMKQIIYTSFKERLSGHEQRVKKTNHVYDNDMYSDKTTCKVRRKELKTIISSFKNNKAAGPHHLLNNSRGKSVTPRPGIEPGPST